MSIAPSFKLAAGAAVVGLLLGFGAGFMVEHWISGAEISRINADHDQAMRAASDKALANERDQRAKEARMVDIAERIVDDARRVTQEMDASRRRADAAAGSLRDAVQAYAAAHCSGTDSAAPVGGAAAKAPGDLLAELLGWADRRSGELAGALDASHAAGRACEQQYDQVRAAQQSSSANN